MEKTAYESGTPCWVDLEAADPAKAVSFYSELLGWDKAPSHPDAGDYQLCLLAGKPVAAISPKHAAGPSFWTTYVSVADLEATTARVLVAGGSVLLGPTGITGQGRLAVYSDSAGATFAAWHPGGHIGSGIVDAPGAMCWHELATRNSITAVDFYREVFDWTATPEDLGGIEYTTWKLGTRSVAGMVQMDGRWPAEAPSHWLTYFAVEDCDASVAKLTEAGGSLLSGPHDVPPGRFAVVADPEDAPFAIMKLR